jgi:hypothetical protein
MFTSRELVKELLRDAAAAKILVLLLTKNVEWATILIGLNDGSKTKPLVGNINN